MSPVVDRVLRRWGSVAAFLAAGFAAVFLLMPQTQPRLRHSSVLDAVFDTRWMIGVGRLVILAGTVYALTSVAVRITRGQWLSKAGPLEAETNVQDVVDDRERLRVRLAEAQEIIDVLTGEIGRLTSDEVAPVTRLSDTDKPGDTAV